MAGGKTPLYEWAQNNAHISNEYVRESLAEVLGTMLLCFMVCGAGFQSILSPDSHLVPVFGTVFGLMISIIVFGGISGAHLNPAVSLGLAIAGHLEWAKLPLYTVSQLLGGFLGSLLAYWLYHDQFYYDFPTAGAGAVFNASSVPDWDMAHGGVILGGFSPTGLRTSLGIGIVSEIVLTAILLMGVMGAIDKGNMKIPAFMVPFLLCLTVAALAMAHGVVSGSVLNPARDLAPRFAAYALGWDRKFVFQNINFEGNTQEWWIVGAFGPPIGGAIGTLIYIFCVGAHLTNNRDELEKNNNDVAPTSQNGGKPDNGDWRNANTNFAPQRAAVQHQQIPMGQQQIPYNQNTNGYGPVNGNGQGYNNGAYIRDDVKQRQQAY